MMSKPPKMPRFAHELFLIQVHPRSSPFIYYLTIHLTLVFCSKRHTNQSKHTQNGKKCISFKNIFPAHPTQRFSHPPPMGTIITTGSAGSFTLALQGPLTCRVLRLVERSANRTFSSTDPKGSHLLTFSPVNGSMYSFIVS